MRLKFIFFPIILVVSLMVFATNIWPQISEVRRINEEKIVKEDQLKTIATTQSAIDAANKKITDGTDGEAAVKNYLPEKKMEERIISGINYLAGDANVALTNVSLTSEDKASSIAAVEVDPMSGLPLPPKQGTLQSMPVKISVSGEYGKIRTFLDGLSHMPIYNTIKSLDIAKQPAEEKDGVAVANNSLVVNIVADFGYMNVAKADSDSVDKFKSGLDVDTIKALGKYVSQKAQPISSENDAKGSTNPFVAN